MIHDHRIQQFSRRSRLLCYALLLLLPCLNALYWFSLNALPAGMHYPLQHLIIKPLDSFTLFLLFLTSLVPLSVVLYGIKQLIKLFKLYENLIIFSPRNIQHYRRLAHTAFAWVFVKILFLPAQSLILSLQQRDNEMHLAIGLETSDILVACIGCVVLLISWTMAQAQALQDEQNLTV